jgi:hypothetical protein
MAIIRKHSFFLNWTSKAHDVFEKSAKPPPFSLGITSPYKARMN